ncbi:MAG TPA: hypothetical protein VNO79_06960 [Actinomycetota bacterium]|nr:hypothetical protein [Actinomycetota bacterium]
MVERLLGLREDLGRGGHRDVTVAELLSWARDPGGDRVFWLAHRDGPEGWRWRRGPLPPDGDLALTLFDFLRAVRTLSLRDQAIVALTAFGFSPTEIARVLDFSGREPSRRELDSRRKRVAYVLEGRPLRDPATGEQLRNEEGELVRGPGIAARIARRMERARREEG